MLYGFLGNDGVNLLDSLGFASVEISKITSFEKFPKSIRVYVKPQNIAKGCELNFIQIAFKDNNEWEVDVGGMYPPPNPPFYYDWDTKWRSESGDSVKDYFIKPDGTTIFEDSPGAKTHFFLFVVERCCVKYYKDVKDCTSCCEKSKATVLKRIYWKTVNGKMEVEKVTDSIKKKMDTLLLKKVHNKTFYLRQCERFQQDNKSKSGEWWWKNPGVEHSVEVILDAK